MQENRVTDASRADIDISIGVSLRNTTANLVYCRIADSHFSGAWQRSIVNLKILAACSSESFPLTVYGFIPVKNHTELAFASLTNIETELRLTVSLNLCNHSDRAALTSDDKTVSYTCLTCRGSYIRVDLNAPCFLDFECLHSTKRREQV